MRRVFFGSLLLALLSGCSPVSDLKRDQELVLFPTVARRSADNRGWDLEIHGCVFEPEKHRIALLVLREALDFRRVHRTPEQEVLLAQRARLFMVDHERGKRIVIQVADKKFKLNKTGPDGQVFGLIHVSDGELKEPVSRSLPVRAVLRRGDPRVFAGSISLLADAGLIVISDIDDTIKITDVRDRNATLRNTFLEPFRAVPGMAELYRRWATNAKADFCYVSASPWQLFQPLADFARSNGFPQGPIYLKQFRWKDESLFNLFEGPEKYKPEVIGPLFEQFPQRRFVLVGDSGERDPEIYGALARRYTNQVARIFIRDVSGEAPDSNRYREAFRDLAADRWRIFRDPADLAGALP